MKLTGVIAYLALLIVCGAALTLFVVMHSLDQSPNTLIIDPAPDPPPKERCDPPTNPGCIQLYRCNPAWPPGGDGYWLEYNASKGKWIRRRENM